MHQTIKSLFCAASALMLGSAHLHATPSTTYWTPCTIDMQAPGVTHITLDDYFTVGEDAPDAGDLPTDVGLTFGWRLGGKAQVEAGFDWLEPSDDPLYLNAKIGYPEGALGTNAPGVQLGFVNFGTKDGVTDQNIVHLIVGKSLPNKKTRVHASYYVGNGDTLRSSSGDKENGGFMIGCDHVLKPGKFILAGDYASGDNAIGGGGIGLYTYFTKDISLLVGPVWFNDKGINGEMKWTTQLDVNF